MRSRSNRQTMQTLRSVQTVLPPYALQPEPREAPPPAYDAR